jgi:hypothetical protein
MVTGSIPDVIGFFSVDLILFPQKFFFFTTSRPALGFTLPPIQWVLAVLSAG